MSKYLKLSSALPGDAETNGLDQFAISVERTVELGVTDEATGPRP